MKKITTVCGDIAPDELGMTSMHDHTFINLHLASQHLESMFASMPSEMMAFRPENYAFLKTGVYLANPELQIMDDVDLLTKEYGFFAALGGKSVCSPTPIGLRNDIRRDRELSQRTGLNIITATGLYHESAMPPEYQYKDEEFYYGIFKDEIENGIEGTDIRPGILKGAFNTGADSEIAAINACIRLSAETGISTHLHTEPTTPSDVIVGTIDAACKRFGTDPDRIVICHTDNRIASRVPVNDYLQKPELDRTLDLELHKRLLGNGYNINLDTWGIPVINPMMFMPDDFERLKALITLIDLGHGDHICLGNDLSSKLACRTYGGYGCTRFIEFGMELMKQLGREDQVRKLLYDNPARILAY